MTNHKNMHLFPCFKHNNLLSYNNANKYDKLFLSQGKTKQKKRKRKKKRQTKIFLKSAQGKTEAAFF